MEICYNEVTIECEQQVKDWMNIRIDDGKICNFKIKHEFNF